MATCDVCGGKLGFRNKFKYADGYICKACYQKASRQFTETITHKSLEEISSVCAEKYELDENFEVTGRIGNYLLIDEKNKKICILNNRLIKEQVTKPEFYSVKEIKRCEVVCEPDMTLKRLEQCVLNKEDTIINSMKVCFFFDGKKETEEISFIKKGARAKSYALRQSFAFAKKIVEEIDRLKEQAL